MSEQDDQVARLERRLEREKAARLSAEALLEMKSRELYRTNQQLSELAHGLERRVEERTLELVTAREHAIELAEIDQLTKLPNRLRFSRELQEAVDRSREDGSSFGLLLIDLDRFKSVNDTLGHDAGDALLRHAAMQFQKALRGHDVIARLGGDEFAVICRSLDSVNGIDRIAERLLTSLQQPFNYQNRPLSSSCSIGFAVFPNDNDQIGELQRFADIALYRSKGAGRGLCTRFNIGMTTEVEQQRWLESDMKRALGEGEVKAWLQPVIDSKRGQWCGAEALARWHHPERGIVMPGSFIKIVEDCGLMRPMFRSMMLESCRMARGWIEAGQIRSISVNVSPSQFRAGSLADDVLGILSAAAFPATSLILEITEEVLLTDLDAAKRQLTALTERGVRIALDDFGSGYSNIGYLQHLPLHSLKLDRSLTANVANDGKARAIVAAVVGIARALDLDVVAEGVETEQQSAWLGRCGCRYLQGYYFGRPMPGEDFARHLGAGAGADTPCQSGAGVSKVPAQPQAVAVLGVELPV